MRQHGLVDRYEIELDTTGESFGERKPVCFVRTGKFAASLSYLSENGHLTDRDGKNTHTIPAYMIGFIEKWAREHGYPV